MKPTLLRDTQFIADGRETFITLLKISSRYTCYTLHKSQGRVIIHTVLIMQLCQSELLNDVELVDTWLATRDPVRAHRLSLSQVDIHHCQGRYCFVVKLTSPNARWGKREWRRSLYSDRYEILRHIGKVPRSQTHEFFLGKLLWKLIGVGLWVQCWNELSLIVRKLWGSKYSASEIRI